MPLSQIQIGGASRQRARLYRAFVRLMTVTTAFLGINTTMSLAGSVPAAGIVDRITTGGICVGSLIECGARKSALVVNFDLGSSALTTVAQRKLDQLSIELTSPLLQAYKVNVDGHTDSVGTETNNLVLSVDRANAVAHYLAKRGVAPARISKAGKGESTPISSPTDPLNRRVDIKYQP